MKAPEILLIDDDVYASVLRKRVLETKGYRVQIALDGTAGIALAEALKPALVMIDHHLPGTCGPEIVRQLRMLMPGCPLVSLSGFDSVAGAYSPAPDAFITKGNGAENMLKTIAGLLP